MPGGEEIKNEIHILERMLKVFNAANLDRRSYVVVVGGGAVLDAVGFAVSIAHRGLRLVRMPTTTLAQADSGIGVKPVSIEQALRDGKISLDQSHQLRRFYEAGLEGYTYMK